MQKLKGMYSTSFHATYGFFTLLLRESAGLTQELQYARIALG